MEKKKNPFEKVPREEPTDRKNFSSVGQVQKIQWQNSPA